MARWEPPYYADWTPEKLKEEIEKLQEERKPLIWAWAKAQEKLKANRTSIQGMQSQLVCNSGLRNTLRGWKPEGA